MRKSAVLPVRVGESNRFVVAEELELDAMLDEHTAILDELTGVELLDELTATLDELAIELELAGTLDELLAALELEELTVIQVTSTCCLMFAPLLSVLPL